MENTLDMRIAEHLRGMRRTRGWSLDDLATRSTISRATLSRLEKGEVSPTAAVLGRLCAAYDVTMSRLIAMAETAFESLILSRNQDVWQDPETGLHRKNVSPPSRSLDGEVVECTIPPGQRISYPQPPRAGLEHHVVMLSGELRLSVGEQTHRLRSGDCLRYRLHGASTFETTRRSSAKYLIFMV